MKTEIAMICATALAITLAWFWQTRYELKLAGHRVVIHDQWTGRLEAKLVNSLVKSGGFFPAPNREETKYNPAPAGQKGRSDFYEDGHETGSSYPYTRP